MKKRMLLSSVLAASILLTGCSGFEDEVIDDGSSGSSVPISLNPQDGTTPERTYDGTGTMLSINGGNLTINRLSRTETKPMAETGWTILVYMCGTDLESNYAAATSDILEAISAQYSDNVRIVYQTGGTNTWNSSVSSTAIQRYVNVDGDLELVGELNDASMGAEATLTDFISWGVENYPAQKMGLVFWNHGGGSISGVCFDEKHDYDSLSLSEIDKSLSTVYDKMTDKFEFIGFDACLMSTLETANMLVPYARYMFASEETEPGGGWNYTDIMNFLAQNPDADGAALGEMQCSSYYQHCIDNGDYEGSTFAITNLSALDDLLVSFNTTAKQLYENGDINAIARAVFKADNFGGNTRSEGYTNMVDLKSMLTAVSPYASNAADTISKLDNVVVSKISGPQHTTAGGLSLYYPLAVQGSTELSTFSSVCTSAYYLALVDKIAYGTTGGDPLTYDNSYLINDIDDINEVDANFNDNIGANNDSFQGCDDESCPLTINNIYFDSDGTYTIDLESLDEVSFATCTLFMDCGDGSLIYLGEDDDVIYNENKILDNFSGEWIYMNGVAMPVEIVSQTEDSSIFTCSILLNGSEENLRIVYDWNTSEWRIAGIWGGIDENTGMAMRSNTVLNDGDIIQPIYNWLDENSDEYFAGDEIIYNNADTAIYYDLLPASDYYYAISIYDTYGNVWLSDFVTFTVDEEGDIWFDETELG